ncbi:hypothetical protein [Tianweitania sediminis]|uniref:Uncharacterized protein n=1 Tax=Tianweitania sediminis TaxID=1502156 RepID=A0A8J7R268_9HYPH|nr:hypothetical protein [Tianweitania sediminis]MBP0439468.1 hypothetical protein [Tianweitania sediminis]
MGMSLELSDGIADLSAMLFAHESGERALTKRKARYVRECLRAMWHRARELENLASRKEWNRLSREEREEREEREQRRREQLRLADALSVPGTNVVLFPIVPRPIPAEQADTGGSAA